MSAALRDCFIKLHSQDLLGDLKAGFQERYAGYVLRKGTKHLKKRKGKTGDALSTSPKSAVRRADLKSAAKKTTANAELEKALARNHGVKVMDIDSIAAEYGISALPPLAIAQDEKLLNEVKERESKSSLMEKSDEQLEAEEDKVFAAEEGIDSEEERDDEEVAAVSGKKELRRTNSRTSTGRKTNAQALESTEKPSKRRGAIELYDLPSAFPDIPPRGDFDLEIIRDSPYFFS